MRCRIFSRAFRAAFRYYRQYIRPRQRGRAAQANTFTRHASAFLLSRLDNRPVYHCAQRQLDALSDYLFSGRRKVLAADRAIDDARFSPPRRSRRQQITTTR